MQKVFLSPKGLPIEVFGYPDWENRVSIGIQVYPNRDSKVKIDPPLAKVTPCFVFHYAVKQWTSSCWSQNADLKIRLPPNSVPMSWLGSSIRYALTFGVK